MSTSIAGLRGRVRRLERSRQIGPHRCETLHELVLWSMRDWVASPASAEEQARAEALDAAAGAAEEIPRGRFGWLAQRIVRARAQEAAT